MKIPVVTRRLLDDLFLKRKKPKITTHVGLRSHHGVTQKIWLLSRVDYLLFLVLLVQEVGLTNVLNIQDFVSTTIFLLEGKFHNIIILDLFVEKWNGVVYIYLCAFHYSWVSYFSSDIYFSRQKSPLTRSLRPTLHFLYFL